MENKRRVSSGAVSRAIPIDFIIASVIVVAALVAATIAFA